MKTYQKKGESSLWRYALAELKYQIRVPLANFGALIAHAAHLIRGYPGRRTKPRNPVRGLQRTVEDEAGGVELPAQPAESARPTDFDIASAAAYQIDLMTSIPSGVLEISVHQGKVTLKGDVEWDYQQIAAGNAVKYLSGVKEVKNLIGLRSPRDAVVGPRSNLPAFKRAGS